MFLITLFYMIAENFVIAQKLLLFRTGNVRTYESPFLPT